MFTTEGYVALSEKAILSRVSEFDIFKFYIPDLEAPNKPFCSELRKDSSPTCRVSLLMKGYRYKDFGDGATYDCIGYIRHKYNLTYFEALQVISNDFKLGIGNGNTNKIAIPVVDSLLGREPSAIRETEIKIVLKERVTTRSIAYWLQYNITPCMLKQYKVSAISAYYVNGTLINIPKAEIAFAYSFGNYKYKILCPDKSDFKWTNNAGGIVQGLSQLPADGDLLYITSSLKDVMALRSVGKLAIAPQSENTLIAGSLIRKLKEKFKKVVLYYNNDEPGINAAEEHSIIYNIPVIYHYKHRPKDPSDYIKELGVNKYKQMLDIL